MTLEVKVVPFKATQLLPDIRERIVDCNQHLGWNATQTSEDFDCEYAEYYVMFVDKCVIGYVGLHNILGEVTFNTVFIASDYRRLGLGYELVTFVLEQLRYRGVMNVFLEVRQANHVAQQLYQKVGFVTLAIRKHYYHNPVDDAVIMQIRLNKGEKT